MELPDTLWAREVISEALGFRYLVLEIAWRNFKRTLWQAVEGQMKGLMDRWLKV